MTQDILTFSPSSDNNTKTISNKFEFELFVLSIIIYNVLTPIVNIDIKSKHILNVLDLDYDYLRLKLDNNSHFPKTSAVIWLMVKFSDTDYSDLVNRLLSELSITYDSKFDMLFKYNYNTFKTTITDNQSAKLERYCETTTNDSNSVYSMIDMIDYKRNVILHNNDCDIINLSSVVQCINSVLNSVNV